MSEPIVTGVHCVVNVASTSEPVRPAPFFRLGKYLIPHSALRFWDPTEPAPTGRQSVWDACALSPHLADMRQLTPSTIALRYEYAVFEGGERRAAELEPRVCPPEYVARLQAGLFYGRHCTAITPSGKVISESGFFCDPGEINAKSRLGRWGLRYYRYRREADVTSRRRLPLRQRVAGTVAGLNVRCSHNYFHWLIDILPRLLLARRIGADADYYLVDALAPYQRQALAALGVSPGQIVQPHCQLLVAPDAVVLPSFPGPTAVRALGRELAERLGEGSTQGPTRLFISRRKAQTRRLQNEDQLERLLSDRGFVPRVMEDYSLAEQCRLVRSAEAIVAVHGAGLANLLFARPGTKVIEIVPAGRYNADEYPKLSRTMGLDHRTVIAPRARSWRQLQAPLEDLAAALDDAGLDGAGLDGAGLDGAGLGFSVGTASRRLPSWG